MRSHVTCCVLLCLSGIHLNKAVFIFMVFVYGVLLTQEQTETTPQLLLSLEQSIAENKRIATIRERNPISASCNNPAFSV